MRAKYSKFDLQPESLDHLEVFEALDAGQRAEVLKYCEGRRYDSRRQIVSHDDAGHDVFFLVGGKVQATIFSSSGKVITFQELREGAMFGELSALDEKPRTANVVAVTESRVIHLPAAQFRELFWAHRSVGEATLRRVTGMVRYLCTRVLEFHLLPVNDRVHAELVRLAGVEEAVDNRVVLSPIPTHADFASRIGTNREAVTRELNALTKSGILERHGRDLIIKDLARLRAMVEEAMGERSSIIT